MSRPAFCVDPEFDGEFLVRSAMVAQEDFEYEPDEVFDAMSAEQLARNITPMLTDEERAVRDSPRSDKINFTPSAMPSALLLALSSGQGPGEYSECTERDLIAQVQSESSSTAILELIARYADILRSAIQNSSRIHSTRVEVDIVQREILMAFTEAILEFDLTLPAEATLFGGPGARPLAFRFAPAVRQAVANETLPVQINGRTVSGALQATKQKSTERVPASQVRRKPNIGVLLEYMLESIEISGEVFTRSQIESASEAAHSDRVAYARFGRIEVGSIYDWAFGDLPASNVVPLLNRLSLVEDDTARSADQISTVTLWHDPVGEARLTTRLQRDQVVGLMAALSDRQRDVVAAVFGIDRDAITQYDYAAENGITQQAVSKSLLNALEIMRAESEANNE